MLRPNSGCERALFGRNRGNEGTTCKEPQARRHTHLGPETASGSGDYVAASTAIGARALQRLHRDRGLTLQAGAAALRRRQGSRTASVANCSRRSMAGSLKALTARSEGGEGAARWIGTIALAAAPGRSMSTTMLVRDHNGQALAISTFEDEPGRRAAAARSTSLPPNSSSVRSQRLIEQRRSAAAED